MAKWLEAIGLSVLAIFAPIQSVLIASGTLILVDLVVGVLAARKGNIPITSAALRRTVSKMFIYQVTILSGFIFEKYLISEWIPVTKLLASIIGTVEIKSILENINIINGSPIFEAIVKQLGSQNDIKKED